MYRVSFADWLDSHGSKFPQLQSIAFPRKAKRLSILLKFIVVKNPKLREDVKLAHREFRKSFVHWIPDSKRILEVADELQQGFQDLVDRGAKL